MKGLIGWQLKFDIYNVNVWYSLAEYFDYEVPFCVCLTNGSS